MYFRGVHLQHQKDTFMLNAVILRRSSHDEARPVTDLSAQQGGLCSSANTRGTRKSNYPGTRLKSNRNYGRIVTSDCTDLLSSFKTFDVAWTLNQKVVVAWTLTRRHHCHFLGSFWVVILTPFLILPFSGIHNFYPAWHGRLRYGETTGVSLFCLALMCENKPVGKCLFDLVQW